MRKCIDILEPRSWDSLCIYCSWEGRRVEFVTKWCRRRRNNTLQSFKFFPFSRNGRIWNLEKLLFLKLWGSFVCSSLLDKRYVDKELVWYWLEFSSTGYDVEHSVLYSKNHGECSPFVLLFRKFNLLPIMLQGRFSF